jgi:hypothetical protein
MRLPTLSHQITAWMLTMISISTLSASCPAHPATLIAMRNCYRPLLIFSSGKDDPKLEKQLDELRMHVADLRERNVLVVVMIEDGDHPTTDQLGSIPMATIDRDEARKIRRRFEIGNDDFVALLVGKDGGEKSRQTTIFPVAKLNTTIDSMPMRQAEMR